MPRCHIILVNWNGGRDTIACLESLLRLDDGGFAITIVDNGSSDGSIERLRAWAAAPALPFAPLQGVAFPPYRRYAPDLSIANPADAATSARISLLPMGENLGFAAANNAGMAFAARDPAARYFWLLNNDTVVRPDSLGALVTHAERHPEQALIGSVLLYAHAPGTVQALGGYMDFARALGGQIGAGAPFATPPSPAEVAQRLAYVVGASMFVRRELWAATGGMCEDFFLYFEELDWARRLPPGMRQGVCLEAVVWHKEGGSIGTSSVARPSDTALYYQSANLLRYFWRHHRRFWPVALARLGWNMALAARARDGAAVLVIARAITDVCRRRRRRGPYGGAAFDR